MGKHVLVIDDNRLILKMLQDTLTDAGYCVSAAEDVLYCNDIIYSKSPPDLILMDINMPHMTGDHKVRIMKNRPKGNQIPIILISSMKEDALNDIALTSGADGYLVKPIEHQLLLETVSRFLAEPDRSPRPVMPGGNSR